MRLGPACLLLLSALGACAPTTGPTALPVEVLVVLDREERSLRLIAIDSTNVSRTIDLSGSIGTAKPTVMAVRGTTAVVGLGNSGNVAIVDLAVRRVVRIVPIQGVGTIAALALTDAGEVAAAVPTSNDANVTFFNVTTLESGGVRVEGGPQAFGVIRGTIFVVLGNRQLCYPAVPSCLDLPSWLRSDPRVSNDSIPILGPGNAVATAPGSDGLLYILNAGNGGTAEARLSGVDPVTRKETSSFAGFGLAPQFMTSDGADRLFVASSKELMVFNVREHRVEKSAGAGIPFALPPRGLVADAFGRIYAPVGGACAVGGAPGAVRVFGTDLVERSTISTGVCPIAAAVTEIPADYFHADL